MNREEVLALEERGWAELMAQIERVPDDRRLEPSVVPGWSVKDLLWHCGKWAEWVREPLQHIEEGRYDPDWEYPWQRYNDDWAEESKTLSWEDVERGASRMRADARASLPIDPPDEAVREFNSETVEHYAEHAAEIAAFATRQS